MHYQIRVFITPEIQGIPDVGIGISHSHTNSRPVAKTNKYGIAKVPVPEINPPMLSANLQDRPQKIFLTLFNQKGSPVLTHQVDATLMRGRKISIPINYKQAILIGLITKKGRRSVQEKQQDLCENWHKSGGHNNPSPTDGLCLAKAVTSIGANLLSPTSALSETVAKLAANQLDASEIQSAADWFGKSKDTMAACWPEVCAGEDYKQWAQKIFMEPDGPGSHVVKALKSSTPDPRSELGDPRAGPGIGRGVEISKKCLARFEASELSNETSRIIDGVNSGELTELTPPSINLIEVWAKDPWSQGDEVFGSTVRLGEVWDQQLTFSERLFLEDGITTVNTDVELDSPECLILEANDQGMQQFFVDVKPGQIITLKGSGFVSSKARALIQFRRYDEADTSELMTFLSNWESHPGFSMTEMEVHSSGLTVLNGTDATISSHDQIVFEWPTAASIPGLYKIDIEFDNNSDHYIDISIDPEICEARLVKDGVVSAHSIYFVVPPDIDRKAGRFRATTVNCLDETNPEALLLIPLADDTNYQVSGFRYGIELKNPDATDPLNMFDIEELGETVFVTANRRFWEDPDSWQANLQAFPESGIATFPLDEMVTMTMTLFEIDSELDQAIIRAVLVVALISLIVMTFFIIAALIALLIATGFLTVSSFGAGAALTVLVAAAAAALTGTFFAAIMAVIAAIVAVVPNAEVIAAGATNYSGLELAYRMSPLRIHRVLWAAERPEVSDASLNTVRLSSSLEDNSYVEVFRSENLGGRYDLTSAVTAE